VSQKRTFFIVTALKTTKLTKLNMVLVEVRNGYLVRQFL
jgi:hypothetical protein